MNERTNAKVSTFRIPSHNFRVAQAYYEKNGDKVRNSLIETQVYKIYSSCSIYRGADKRKIALSPASLVE